MKRLLSLCMIPALMAGLGVAQGRALAGCRGGACHGGVCYDGHGSCCPPYWCDPYADLHPWPDDNPLYDGPRNWSWWYPHGGFTAYLGLPGSGVQAPSDYSHINWVIPPHVNANMVLQKLEMLGVPLVPQETMYLGKNPAHVAKTKLPVPGRWIKEKEKEKEREKELKDKEKDKDKDLDR
jgi:hypothetical protein